MSPADNAYGRLVAPTTLEIRRLLPGTVERVWAYLTQAQLRRKWLAAGEMVPEAGAPFELVWHNDELTDPPGHRPDGFGKEIKMASRVVAIDPPRRLVIGWGAEGEVAFDLAPAGDRVLLTVTHRRLADRDTRLNVGAGWHAHLDVLEAVLAGSAAAPFWDNWVALRGDYESLVPRD